MFVIGALLANHVLSAIDAVYTVHAKNKEQQSALSWNVRFGDEWNQPAVNFQLTAVW